MASFQVIGLPAESFTSLFALSDAQLATRGARRVIADANPGYPCRVSLADATVGEELLLLPYEHQPADSPYRASGPIYVRRHAQAYTPAPDEIPEAIRRRLLSLRAYDAEHMMIGAAVCEGAQVATEILQQFSNPQVAYIHLHNARPGCFACRVERVM